MSEIKGEECAPKLILRLSLSSHQLSSKLVYLEEFGEAQELGEGEIVLISCAVLFYKILFGIFVPNFQTCSLKHRGWEELQK